MITEKEILLTYKLNGVNILGPGFENFRNPKKFSKETKEKFEPNFYAAKQVLGREDVKLKQYWDTVAPALLGVFLRQLRKPGKDYKNWGVTLPILKEYPETYELANLARATSREKALLAMKRNNELAADRYEQGGIVVLAADGEMLGSNSLEVDVCVARPDTNWQRKFVTYQINRWMKSDTHHMTMTWLAQAGWPPSSQNLDHSRTVVFTNLLKNVKWAREYCGRFDWKYPGEEKIKEAMAAVYIAHENGHEKRIMSPRLNELSADLLAWTCVVDLSQKGLLGSIGIEDIILAIFAEYAIQAKAQASRNETIDAYRLSGIVAMDSMLKSKLIVPRRKNLKLDMTKVNGFYKELAKYDQMLDRGGITSIPALPVQLLNML